MKKVSPIIKTDALHENAEGKAEVQKTNLNCKSPPNVWKIFQIFITKSYKIKFKEN